MMSELELEQLVVVPGAVHEGHDNGHQLVNSSGEISTSLFRKRHAHAVVSLVTGVMLFFVVLISSEIGHLESLAQRDNTAAIRVQKRDVDHPVVATAKSRDIIIPVPSTTSDSSANMMAIISPEQDEYPSEPILLQHQHVGTISRLCQKEQKGSNSTSSCWLMESDQWHTCNNNGPKAIHSQPWMHPELYSGHKKLVLYYGSHSGDGTKTIRALISSQHDNGYYGPFEHIMNISIPFTHCESIHSPSLFVDNDIQKLYMYVHGHGCVGNKRGQPTYVLTSTDGLTWESPTAYSNNENDQENSPTASSVAQQNGLIFNDIFYLTAPIKLNGWFYAIGKTQENQVGSTILCRSRSLGGPFERGPLLAKGMRHGDMHLMENTNTILIFYTLIGDAPERILLATLEMHDNNDWESWRLLPGPTILVPTLEFEHGNANVTKPSTFGSAGCKAHAQFRDPSFLRDDENTSGGGGQHRLTGTLFYTVQGERAFAASRLDIDLGALFGATRFRDKTLIPDEILHASSLASSSSNTNGSLVIETPVLFTGTGRSGTMFLCKMFQAIGLNISHDNDKDCGPYPGTDGASSWYDAFKTNLNGKRRVYKEVIHIVRNPINVIESRAFRLAIAGRSNINLIGFLEYVAGQWESVGDLFPGNSTTAAITYDDGIKFALKHWVRRNAFVRKTASWVEQIEQLSTEPLVAWRMCMAAGFGPRCPPLEHWRNVLASTSTHTNTEDGKQTSVERRTIDWSTLLQLEPIYAAIAIKMSLEFGYQVLHEHLYDNIHYGDISTLQYQCGFDENQKWDCWVY